jgi:crossover junction endodeoxyribonuclease RuvC
LKAVIGIDPGSTGAAVLIAEDGTARMIEFEHQGGPACLPTLLGNWDLQYELLSSRVFMEKVGAMPTDGKHNSFTFGFNTGFIHGVLAGIGIFSPVEVAPQTWQRFHNLGGKLPNRKAAHAALAKKLRPELHVTQELGDAILIAEYAWHRSFNANETAAINHLHFAIDAARAGSNTARNKSRIREQRQRIASASKNRQTAENLEDA